MTRTDAIWILSMIRDRDAKTDAEKDAINTAITSLTGAAPENGHWKEVGGGIWQCDQCGEITTNVGDLFCRHCGAAMVPDTVPRMRQKNEATNQ